MVRSPGSYCRTRRKAPVEMVTSDAIAGPAMFCLEKCPPNRTVCRRLDADPRASAKSAGLSGCRLPLEYSGMRKEQVGHDEVHHGERNRSQHGRQESVNFESR